MTIFPLNLCKVLEREVTLWWGLGRKWKREIVKSLHREVDALVFLCIFLLIKTWCTGERIAVVVLQLWSNDFGTIEKTMRIKNKLPLCIIDTLENRNTKKKPTTRNLTVIFPVCMQTHLYSNIEACTNIDIYGYNTVLTLN